MVSYRRGRVAIAPFFPALSLLAAVPALAQEPAAAKTAPSSASDAPADRYVLTARSESHLQFFQRALLPGPNGAIVTDETAIPFTEYVTVDARDVDAPWQRDSIDVEFAAWGQLWPTSSDYERPFDGDVQVASIRFDGGPAWVRLGRQQVAGGAARFARFDGVMVGAGQSLGFFAEGYGGYGVLPRWNEQPGYHHLGSAEGELIDDDVGAPQERGSNWLAGARAGYTMARLSGSVSFHEQHETGGLERRNLGLDVGAHPFDAGSMGARALLELDSMRLANLRAWIDTHAAQSLDLGAEVSHSEPALLLSRQSVLSVFTTDGYDEFGGTFALRMLGWLRLEGNGFVQDFEDSGPGARGELAARLASGRLFPTMVRVAYARVIAPENGYHSVRVSLSRTFSRRVRSTLEAYGYFYDQPILDYSTSSVFSATLSYRVSDPFELLWGGSLASSPYAAVDAQTLLRAVYEFDASPMARQR